MLDEEDNRPVFDADFYRFSVREGEVTTIGTVSATDSDSGLCTQAYCIESITRLT